MKKKLIAGLMLSALMLGSFSACAKQETPETTAAQSSAAEETKKEESSVAEETKKEAEYPDFSGKTLSVVATSDKYASLFDEFTKLTNAKVEFLSMSSGEVLARAKAEGKPGADIWFGGGLDAFMAAKTDGLLENYVSPNSSDIPEQYKDAEGAWIAKGITVVGFIANNTVLEEKGLEVPKSWEEIADPKYKGEVIMSNPAISGTNYAMVKGLLDMYGEEKGWDYLTKFNGNVAFYSKRGKDPQEKTVAGEFAVGIIPVDKSAFKAAEDNGLTVVYPEDGIPWVPEGVAIFKNGENLDVSKAFIDFMLTEEAQKMIAELDGKDSAQIVKPGVEGLSLGLPKDKLIKEDLSTFGSERENILTKFKTLSEGKEATE